MRSWFGAGLLCLGLTLAPAVAAGQEIDNIGETPGVRDVHYGSVRGWEILSGRERGRVRYCYAAVDRDGNGDDVRIGYSSGQWQIAVPVRARPDWYGQLEIDGRVTGASGTAGRGWTFAWIGLPELDALRAGDTAILSVGKFDVEFSLSGVTAATLMVEECVDRRGDSGGGYAPAPVGSPNPPAPPAHGGPRPPRPAFLDWVNQAGGRIDRRAARAGREANGEPLYVCSAQFNGGVHPGKLRRGFGGCVVGYGGREFTVEQYSTLIGKGRWQSGVPADRLDRVGVNGGQEANGSPLYVCRADFNNGVHPGKVGASTGGCNITYGGVERTVYFYEVLTR